MIILTLVDGYEEIFVTFHLLKSCRSTTRYHSVLDIERVHSPYPVLLGNWCCSFVVVVVVVFVFVCFCFAEDFVDHFSSSFRRFPLQLSRFLH